MKALIFAGGYGTRLGKLTKNKPKPMIKVAGKPVLEHLVDQLNKHGITEIIIKVHYKKEKIIDYFGDRVMYYYEPKLLPEAQTEEHLQDWLGDEYIVMNGDTLNNFNLSQFIAGSKSSGCALNAIFAHNGHYAGTKYVRPAQKVYIEGKDFTLEGTTYVDEGEYYFDIGTPQKLAKARRYYAKHR